MEYMKLNDGLEIPAIGFGTFMIPADGTTYETVKTAIDLGIRHIDTATAYFNEQEVGQAVKDSEVEREDYMDLYLLHQPYGKVDEAWRALEEAKEEGKILSVGVSNMTPKLWNKWVPDFDSIPSVNQVEFNPYIQQKELKEILNPLDVKIQAWGPLGRGNADLLNNPIILELAEKYGKNAGQIILRFENQEGIIVFPKSLNPERIKSNMEIFDFKLTDSEMDKLRALDTGKGSHDPDAPGVGEMLMNAFDVHANE